MALTITNTNVPGAPTTTAPTQAQMQNQNSCVGQLNFANDANSQAIITHNFNLPASDISQGYPFVGLTPLDFSVFGTNPPNTVLVSQNPNYVVFNKNNFSLGGASVPQYEFVITRPHTIVR